MVKSAGRRSLPKFQKQFKQQRQQRWLKMTYYSTYETRENFDSFSLSTLSDISQTEYKTASNFEKEIMFKSCARTVHVLSNMENVAFSRCCFVTFYKQRQRNEQRIIMHACTAIVLVAVAIKLCLVKLPKIEYTAKK